MENSTSFKIFLVDDDPFSLCLYEQHLRNSGVTNISTFENGTLCLNHLGQQPDVIFLDHNMEILDGVEILRKIKRFNPDIQVVFVSGQEDVSVAVNSLKYGAFDYIIKGNDDLNKIDQVLEKIAAIRNMLQQKNKSILRKFLPV
ncbi:MAG: response regulator [Bacteroidetes bacterium]|nr:response regulator [Bacteroidota bacterium]